MFALRTELVARYLVPISLLYLALPNVIFCIGWLEWYWALMGICLLAAALTESTLLAFRQEIPATVANESSYQVTLRHAFLFLVILLVWVGFSGVGELSFQKGDWYKHESILKDLIEYNWPVVYDFFADPLPLVYYIAFYLPAALAGKIGGWGAAQLTLFIWTYLGVIIAVLWFWILVRRISYSMLLLFMLFSGIDVVGKIITQMVGWSIQDWTRIERFSLDLEYSANTVLLYWVPNQALGGWITVGLIMYAILHIRQRATTWFPFGLSMLWSPLVTIGLIPYLLTEFLSQEAPLHVRLKRYVSWSSLGGLAIFLLVALFYSSKLYEASPYMHSQIPHSFFFSSNRAPLPRQFSILMLFLFIEVGVYGFLLWKSIKSDQRLWRWLFAATIIFLILLPFYRLGEYNDWVMRASIPALFCLTVLVGRTLQRNVLGVRTQTVLIVALTLGAVTSIADARYNVIETYREIVGIQSESDDKPIGVTERYILSPTLLLQYVGGFESPFFQYLSKEKVWASQARYVAFADNRILFESYQLDKEDRLKAGDQLQIISKLHVFYWLIDRNYNISLRLVAEAGEQEVWKEQGWPENRPTSIWAPTVTWYDTRNLTIPQNTPPGIYRLDLSFADPVARDLLQATAMPEAKPLGQIVPIGFVTVGEMASRPEQPFAQPAQLDGKIALVGITLDAEEQVVAPGQTLHVELFWEAMTRMDQNYTGFVHMLAADGTLIAQNDHQPRNGFLPTRIWRTGVTIPDTYTLLVPETAAPGTYVLKAGMYDLETGARLPVSQDGKPVGDALEIAQLHVQ